MVAVAERSVSYSSKPSPTELTKSEEYSLLTPELREFLTRFDRPPVHAHFHQPQRRLAVENNIVFDISGLDQVEGGWNGSIAEESPIPMAKRGLFKNPFMGWDAYGACRDWVKVNKPELWGLFMQGAAENSPTGDTYYHSNMPLVSYREKRRLVELGMLSYQQDFGKMSETMWLAECGVDSETLEVLVEKGIQAFYAKRSQFNTLEDAPAYSIKTKNGRILGIPFDDSRSGEVAFHDILNADAFAKYEIGKTYWEKGFVEAIATDGENWGHQRKPLGNGENSINFVSQLVNVSLPTLYRELNITQKIRPEDIKEATIRENSSWSCSHGVARWTGECDCGKADEGINKQKREFYKMLTEQNKQIEQYLDKQAADVEKKTRKKVDWEKEHVHWMLSQREDIGKGEPIDLKNAREEFRSGFMLLYLNQVGNQSDARFFGRDDQGRDLDYERNIARKSIVAVEEYSKLIFQ